MPAIAPVLIPLLSPPDPEPGLGLVAGLVVFVALFALPHPVPEREEMPAKLEFLPVGFAASQSVKLFVS